jgi:hypothetical protein
MLVSRNRRATAERGRAVQTKRKGAIGQLKGSQPDPKIALARAGNYHTQHYPQEVVIPVGIVLGHSDSLDGLQ